MRRRVEQGTGPRTVRLQPEFGLCAELFRVLPKAARRPTLDVVYWLDTQKRLRFSAREALGVAEQTLLLVLLELAGQQYATQEDAVLLSASDRRELPSRLWAGLHRADGGGGSDSETLMLSTTWEEINRRCGTGNGGPTIAARRESLRRLCEVVVWEEEGDSSRRVRQSYLAVQLLGDDRRIHVALNPRLARAFLGGQYARVSLAERLRLRQDVAMHLHAFLSTTVRPGHQLRVGLEKLISRAWPVTQGQAQAVPTGTAKRRVHDVRRALTAIGALANWNVRFDGNGIVTVHRRAPSPVRDRTSAKRRALDALYREPCTSE